MLVNYVILNILQLLQLQYSFRDHFRKQKSYGLEYEGHESGGHEYGEELCEQKIKIQTKAKQKLRSVKELEILRARLFSDHDCLDHRAEREASKMEGER